MLCFHRKCLTLHKNLSQFLLGHNFSTSEAWNALCTLFSNIWHIFKWNVTNVKKRSFFLSLPKWKIPQHHNLGPSADTLRLNASVFGHGWCIWQKRFTTKCIACKRNTMNNTCMSILSADDTWLLSGTRGCCLFYCLRESEQNEKNMYKRWVIKDDTWHLLSSGKKQKTKQMNETQTSAVKIKFFKWLLWLKRAPNVSACVRFLQYNIPAWLESSNQSRNTCGNN